MSMTWRVIQPDLFDPLHDVCDTGGEGGGGGGDNYVVVSAAVRVYDRPPPDITAVEQELASQAYWAQDDVVEAWAATMEDS